jgi:MFS family permease
MATIIDPILVLLYGLFAKPPVERADLTATMVVISVVSGFLSYLIGGYVAARMADRSGGKHGALTAVFGLGIGIAMGIVLVLFGLVFTKDITTLPAGFGLPDVVPPVSFGLAGPAPVAGSILFLVNLFGGFVGGRLGEPSCLDEKRIR